MVDANGGFVDGNDVPAEPVDLEVAGEEGSREYNREEVVEGCVEYVFGPGFDDENERNAFVDGFRNGGRYATLDGLLSNFEAAGVNDPDYLVLNEVSSFLNFFSKAEREVVFQNLKTALLAKRAQTTA